MQKMVRKEIHKKGMVADYLPWLLIAIAVLTIIVISAIFLKKSGFSLIDKIKQLFGGR